MIDARAMVRRHAAELLLLAVGAGAIALAVWGGVAHAQAIDPMAADYPVDFNAIIWGGGGAGAVGGLGLVGWLISQRYAPLLRRRERGDDKPDKPDLCGPMASDVRPRLDALEAQCAEFGTEIARLSTAVRHNTGTSTRIEARLESLSQTASQIMLKITDIGRR